MLSVKDAIKQAQENEAVLKTENELLNNFEITDLLRDMDSFLTDLNNSTNRIYELTDDRAIWALTNFIATAAENLGMATAKLECKGINKDVAGVLSAHLYLREKAV